MPCDMSAFQWIQWWSVPVTAALSLWLASGVDGQGREIPFHRLTRPYISSGVTIPHWDFGGNAIITGDQIRLTSDRQSQLGYIWNTRPITYADWEVSFEYKVHGQGSRLFGDGFAFWFVSSDSFMDHTKNGLTGPTFGGPERFDGMLLSFDTYRNGNFQHQFPWIGLMHGVPGGKLYDADNDNKDNELDGCLHRFRNAEEVTKVRIINIRGTLGVYTSKARVGFPDKWEECILVTDIWLPRAGHFGFTAHTGEVADNHDIHHFYTHLIDYVAIPERQREAMKEASHRPAFVSEPTGTSTGPAAPVPKSKAADDNAAKHEHAYRAAERARDDAGVTQTSDTVKTFVLYFFQVFLGLCGLAVAIAVVAIMNTRSKGAKNAKRFT